MRSRLAITVMLVLGLMLSTTGVGLAISGSSGSGSAGNAQYPTTPTTPQVQPRGGSGGGVLGATNETPPPPSNGSSPAAESTPPVVQATRQVSTESGSGQLPFTGFAVIPIIAAGVALLLAGTFLRRRSGPSRS